MVPPLLPGHTNGGGIVCADSHAAPPRIVAYMRNHMIDAHLTLVQICRVCLAGFGIVAFVAAVGGGTGVSQRHRMQCAATAASCAISTRYYTRLYALRRLPLSMGYSLESNTVAESMRYANWSIVIALLGWCAFLLRGPFETEYYGPWKGWEWSYGTWSIAGPLLSSFGTIVGLPGWHASRTARACQCRGDTCSAVGWALACACFLGISSFLSLLIGAAMLAPSSSKNVRTPTELALGRSISALWFVYPIVSLIRTLALMLGAGDRLAAPSADGGPSGARSGTPTPFGFARRAALGASAVASNVVRSAYLAFVAAPDCKSTVAVTRLTALADGILSGNDMRRGDEVHRRETHRLLPMSDLVDISADPESDHDVHELRMRMHVPEVSPLCSQGTDSIIAVVDICSQAIAALGCAAITLTLE